jgi:hypothetical protein
VSTKQYAFVETGDVEYEKYSRGKLVLVSLGGRSFAAVPLPPSSDTKLWLPEGVFITDMDDARLSYHPIQRQIQQDSSTWLAQFLLQSLSLSPPTSFVFLHKQSLMTQAFGWLNQVIEDEWHSSRLLQQKVGIAIMVDGDGRLCQYGFVCLARSWCLDREGVDGLLDWQ